MAELKSSQVLSLLRKELKQEISEQIEELYKLLTQGDSGPSEDNGDDSNEESGDGSNEENENNSANNICYKSNINIDIPINRVGNVLIDLWTLVPNHNRYEINIQKIYNDNWYYLQTTPCSGEAFASSKTLSPKAIDPDITEDFIQSYSLSYELTDAGNGVVVLNITGHVYAETRDGQNSGVIYVTWPNNPIYYIEKQHQIPNTYWHVLDAELVDSESNSLYASTGDIQIYDQKMEIIRCSLKPTENLVLKLKCIT